MACMDHWLQERLFSKPKITNIILAVMVLYLSPYLNQIEKIHPNLGKKLFFKYRIMYFVLLLINNRLNI